MHAAIFNVKILDRSAAEAGLREQVVPDAEAAPGFVAGYWLDRGNDRGMAVVVFDSQENAQAWVDGPAPPGDAPITRESSEVVAVVAHA
jgi:heme-degrading monooxygenase HmoA